MQQTKRPYFLVIDGIDGSGKSTQCKLLSNYLSTKKVDFILTKEPGGTEVGNILRNILISSEYNIEPETELLLYSADRLEHQKKVIEPALENNKIIICDRFISSTYAYQVFGRGLNIDTLKLLEKLTVFYWPNLTILIDIPIKIALERAIKRLKEYEKIDSEGKFEKEGLNFYKKVRDGFIWYSKNYKNVIILDGNKDIESLSKEIISLVKKELCL
ncbi:dTMP kinase [Deferribacter thermophilus]|uniref:dTMP kinase n=1 Tax=Deferribacter thermophilus TaxID=53573 RepID=UPI003C278ED7